jgi:hypothetical protein
MRPVVFVGIDLANDGQGQLYTSRTMTHITRESGIRPRSLTTAAFDVFLPTDVGFVFDYEHAWDALLRCSLQPRGFRLTDE